MLTLYLVIHLSFHLFTDLQILSFCHSIFLITQLQRYWKQCFFFCCFFAPASTSSCSYKTALLLPSLLLASSENCLTQFLNKLNYKVCFSGFLVPQIYFSSICCSKKKAQFVGFSDAYQQLLQMG